MITKSLALLSSVILTVFCMCCSEDDLILEADPCQRNIELVSSPPTTDSVFVPFSLRVSDDCLVSLWFDRQCEPMNPDTRSFAVVSTGDSPRLFFRRTSQSGCPDLSLFEVAFDLVPLRTESDSLILAFPELDTTLVYRY